jgi:hypothetical protein
MNETSRVLVALVAGNDGAVSNFFLGPPLASTRSDPFSVTPYGRFGSRAAVLGRRRRACSSFDCRRTRAPVSPRHRVNSRRSPGSRIYPELSAFVVTTRPLDDHQALRSACLKLSAGKCPARLPCWPLPSPPPRCEAFQDCGFIRRPHPGGVARLIRNRVPRKTSRSKSDDVGDRDLPLFIASHHQLPPRVTLGKRRGLASARRAARPMLGKRDRYHSSC